MANYVVVFMKRSTKLGADRERSLRVLRRLPADIWVTNHARMWGRYCKFVASQSAKNIRPQLNASVAGHTSMRRLYAMLRR